MAVLRDSGVVSCVMVTCFGKETAKVLFNLKITVSGLGMLSEVYPINIFMYYCEFTVH